MTSQAEMFYRALSLVGKHVEVGFQSSGEQVKGVIINAMFDSLLLAYDGNHCKVVPFNDLMFLRPMKEEPHRAH